MESAILSTLGGRLSRPTQTFFVAACERAAGKPVSYKITISYTRTVELERGGPNA